MSLLSVEIGSVNAHGRLAGNPLLKDFPCKTRLACEELLKNSNHWFCEDSSWNGISDSVIRRLTQPLSYEKKMEEVLRSFLKNLDTPFYRDIISRLCETFDFQIQSSFTSLLPPDTSFFEMKPLLEFLAHSSKRQNIWKKEQAAIASRLQTQVKPRFLDNVLSAYSYFSPCQKTESPWQAKEMIQMLLVTALLPIIVSSQVEDLLKPFQIQRITILFFLVIGMAAIVTTLNLYQKHYQLIPTHVEPFRNYTFEASQGRFEPLPCRQTIIDSIFECWESVNRDTRQTPVLVGSSGVGKTVIMKELARQALLKNKGLQIYSVRASKLVSTSPMMDSMEKISKNLKTFESHKHKLGILIDEIHTLWSPNLVEIVKDITDSSDAGFPYLLGATTNDEFNKLSDLTVLSRIRPIYVEPTDDQQTFLILRNMSRRHAPEMDIPDEFLLAIFRETTTRLSKYNQPDISKRILSRVFPKIRKEFETNEAAKGLEELQRRADSLAFGNYSVSAAVELKQVLQKIKETEKSFLFIESKKSNWKQIHIKLVENKDRYLTLAEKIIQAYNTDQNIADLMNHFTFVYSNQRTFLSCEKNKLEEWVKIPELNEKMIAIVIDEFLENESKASQATPK